LLGKGGMGEVYRARNLKLKREVAIKILQHELRRVPAGRLGG
jgi:serine/threonine-protein kinase